MHNTEQTARLRYRCRRGLLELDTLLARFIDSPQFTQLSPTQCQAFEVFLDEPDPQLLAWLMGQEICDVVDYQKLIEAIHGSDP